MGAPIDYPLAAGLAPASHPQARNDAAGARDALQQDALRDPHQGGAGEPPSHGLISKAFHTAIDGVASVFGASDGSAQSSFAWDASDALATFSKSVPLFLGPGRGRIAAMALTGLDEVRWGDSTANQATDFLLGAAKGLATKTLMDRYGTAEMSLLGKGAIIGGGSSFAGAVLSRRSWLNAEGKFDPDQGWMRVAEQTALGTGIGMVSFPLASSLGAKITPAAESWLGSRLNPGLITSLTTGGAFGVTSGFVGETTRELLSGQGLNPLTIAKHTLLEGASTMAAAGTGFGITGGRAYLPESARPQGPAVEIAVDPNASLAPRNPARPSPDASSPEPVRADAQLKPKDAEPRPSSPEQVPYGQARNVTLPDGTTIRCIHFDADSYDVGDFARQDGYHFFKDGTKAITDNRLRFQIQDDGVWGVRRVRTDDPLRVPDAQEYAQLRRALYWEQAMLGNQDPGQAADAALLPTRTAQSAAAERTSDDQGQAPEERAAEGERRERNQLTLHDGQADNFDELVGQVVQFYGANTQFGYRLKIGDQVWEARPYGDGYEESGMESLTPYPVPDFTFPIEPRATVSVQRATRLTERDPVWGSNEDDHGYRLVDIHTGRTIFRLGTSRPYAYSSNFEFGAPENDGTY